MKKREKELLFQLLRNSKLSDREIAKRLKTSQSTITRNRHKLERKFIHSYTVVPNLSELNISLIAFTFGRGKPNKTLAKRLKNFLAEQPCIIFLGLGEGMGKLGITVSFHKDFSDYMRFMNDIRMRFRSIQNLESFIVPTDTILGTLSMARAVESLVKKE